MTRDFGARPCAAREWYKAHGLGNDYLVFEEGDGWRAGPVAVKRVCHRWEGIGADGIVIVLREEKDVAASVRMFNPDGSEFERSGNGLRVLAAWLHRHGRVGEEPFTVAAGGDAIGMRVHSRDSRGRYDIGLEMGKARLGPGPVALAADALDGLGRIALADFGPVPVVPVSIGNPHAVVFADEDRDFERATLDRLGPALATHPGFAHGTNVQLARPVPPATLDILIWERGVGPTTASGTSACAAAAAAVAGGRLDAGPIEVRMEGGGLQVRVDDKLEVALRGPVQEVGVGELADGFVRGLHRER